MTQHKIDVVTSGFEGDYLILKHDVPPSGTDQHGNKFDHWATQTINGDKIDLELESGKYTFHVRGNVLGCYFEFEVSDSGVISGISSPLSAEAVNPGSGNSRLRLLTDQVTIHPAGYAGKFITNLMPYDQEYCFGGDTCSSKTFVVIREVLFYVSNGSSRGTSRVGGYLHVDGTVDPESVESAIGGDRTFTLRTTTLGFITPKKKFWVSGYKKPIKVNKNVIVMRGVHLEVKTKKDADRPAIVFRPY